MDITIGMVDGRTGEQAGRLRVMPLTACHDLVDQVPHNPDFAWGLSVRKPELASPYHDE